MSKILRRPMFRGGRVDSRGTGITSGLIDRPGLQSGGTPTGAEIKAMAEKNIFGVPALRDLNRSTNFINDLGFNYGIRPLGNLANMGTNYILGTDIPMIQKRDSNKPFEDILQKEATRLSNELIPQVDEEDEYEEGYSDISEITKTKKRQEKEDKKLKKELNPNEVELPKETELSTRDLIKQNADLFNEFLNEGNEKKIKEARIQDASDYALKLFSGSQKEGATVGSAAAEVADFATKGPSKTETAKKEIDKSNKTGVALAINDYIAGKRSKEQVEALMAKSDLALGNKMALLQMAKEDLAGNIRDSKLIGTDRLVEGIKNTPRLKGMPIETFDSEKGEVVEYNDGDENKIFIDIKTNSIFSFNKDGTKSFLY